MDRRSMIKSLGAISAISSLSACNMTDKASDDLPVIETDILIVGGGTAGIVAAIQTARTGCKTTLVEAGSVLGGTMTTGGVSFPGLFHAWGKQVIDGIGWELVKECVELNGDQLQDFTIPFGRSHPKHQIVLNPYLYALLAEEKCLASGVNIRYYETPMSISLKSDRRWKVEVAGKGTHKCILCKQIIDCTGNASMAAMAGYKLLKENETQPGSQLFSFGGIDTSVLDKEEINTRYKEALKNKTLSHEDGYGGIWGLLNAKRYLATEHVLHADSSTSELHTKANLNGRASLLRVLRFIKSLPGCEKAYIKTMQPEVSIRETYRIDGEYQITQDDYVTGKVFEDSIAYSYYPIDLHKAEGVRPKHLTEGKVATIPYRALIPKGSTNLIVAGRCVSSDRLANSALRVQASCMAMGQAAACAAALAVQNNLPLMKVPVADLKELIKKNKGIVP